MSDSNTTRTGADDKAPENIARLVVELYDDWYEREQQNVLLAYEDLRFSREGDQWAAEAMSARKAENRPILTINKCPQYVRQVTGDIRMSRPAVKVTPVDDSADQKTAEVLGGMVRYVENRSDAQAAYYMGCDTQVTAGVGAWQVITEYAGDDTFNLEIGIMPVDDAIAIAWDPDSVLPTREDATWCIVPVDLSRKAFEKRFPGKTAADFDTLPTPRIAGWWSQDSVRVATYWCKHPVKRKLALMPNASIIDLSTIEDKRQAAEIERAAERVEDRQGHKVMRHVVSAMDELEKPVEWIGKYIPVIPVIGEEVRIGRKVYRNGLIRWMKDSQRAFNYAYATNVEVVAMQPKSPFVGTVKNFEKYEQEWADANSKNQPFIPYTPDPANNGIAPQRVQPAVGSSGLQELMMQSAQDLKDVTGLHDASLGARSNETSGRAIIARQREGDVSTYVYQDNFARAVRYTGKIVIDLIPKVYDTPRTLRIIGEDGKPDIVQINQKHGETRDPTTGQVIDTIRNDVTTGSYDVVLETGPSFSTRREEAREGMNSFLQGNPNAAPLILDLVADAQDWPNSDKIAKRFKTLLPPPIQAMEAEESGEPMPKMPQAPGPDPMVVAEQQAKTDKAKFDARKSQAEAMKAEIELQVLVLQTGIAPQPMGMDGPPKMQPPGPPMPGGPMPPEFGSQPPMGPAGPPGMPPMMDGAAPPHPQFQADPQGQPPPFG